MTLGKRGFEAHESVSWEPPTEESRWLGCMLGGAVGDALGAPIEFSTLDEIRAAHGPQGVTGFVAGGRVPGTFTDDTQMTLFTAEGLIRADNRMRERGICDVPRVIWRAYQRWLNTQGELVPWDQGLPAGPSGWLDSCPELRFRRAPGKTCIAALRSAVPGTFDAPLNQSKGCGGVMRVAPVGLVGRDAFGLGCESAAITHGHPTGYLASGAFAAIVAGLARGQTLLEAILEPVNLLSSRPGCQETVNAIWRAMELAQGGATPTPGRVESLGQGWVAEEALAIAVYCALVARDFRQGVLLAVNHGGDSDSTGSMTGNLLGAMLGVGAIPAEWRQRLVARELVETVARDLFRQFRGEDLAPEGDQQRYPPW